MLYGKWQTAKTMENSYNIRTIISVDAAYS